MAVEHTLKPKSAILAVPCLNFSCGRCLLMQLCQLVAQSPGTLVESKKKLKEATGYMRSVTIPKKGYKRYQKWIWTANSESRELSFSPIHQNVGTLDVLSILMSCRSRLLPNDRIPLRSPHDGRLLGSSCAYERDRLQHFQVRPSVHTWFKTSFLGAASGEHFIWPLGQKIVPKHSCFCKKEKLTQTAIAFGCVLFCTHGRVSIDKFSWAQANGMGLGSLCSSSNACKRHFQP